MSHFFTADTHFGHGNIIKYCRRFAFMNSTEKQMMEWADKGTIPQEEIRISRETVDKMDRFFGMVQKLPFLGSNGDGRLRSLRLRSYRS